MPGPPPKPPGTRARRNVEPASKRLPAKGRGGRKAPDWPLRPDRDLERKRIAADVTLERLRADLNECSDRRKAGRLEREIDQALATATSAEAQLTEQAALEADMWRQLWDTPQAVAWEEYGWVREVALYVRCSLRAEDGDMRAAGEARQRSDRLGLSPLAMLRLHWEVAPAVVEQAAAPPAKGKAKRGEPVEDPRRILHAV